MSTTGSSSEAGAKPALTDRELEILKNAWNCMKTAPEIDYPRLAAACGMTNPRSASNAWGGIKKKLFADLPAPVDEDGNPIVTPSKRKRVTATKKKAAPAPAGDEDDELANSDGEEKLVVETPKKKRPTASQKKAAAAAAATADGEGVDGEDTAPETPAKKKRTPAKRKTPAKGKKAAAAATDADNEEEAGVEAADDETPAADVAKLEVKDDDKKDVDMEKGENPGEI
ncbi:hypothetical protein ColTof4_08963 [Colletotrichum tofieldiae]|nr:hypothetical protein ColTof3_03830 [Colletotrichum tofieldiae]GKT76540.1 hypothetical protein ColTof4_08963 [Colletotrichum tofieldiae]